MEIDFIFYHEYEDIWNDGLKASLDLLSEDYTIRKHNLIKGKPVIPGDSVVLAWGAFGSPADKFCRDLQNKKALCIAGVTNEPEHSKNYDILFYETDWFGKSLKHKNKIKAFGINSDIYRRIFLPEIWDYISVGSLSYWKRHELILNKKGSKLVVGEFQSGNKEESSDIATRLLAGGCSVMSMLDPCDLNVLYNMCQTAYIPATINGGGERAVLEARSCGLDVLVENDNPKLKELLYGPIFTQLEYSSSLKKGIESL